MPRGNCRLPVGPSARPAGSNYRAVRGYGGVSVLNRCTKEICINFESPLTAIMDALDAHTAMSSQALNSQKIQDGLKDTLLGPAQLYEALRARSSGQSLQAGG